jgi:hypothetical protein
MAGLASHFGSFNAAANDFLIPSTECAELLKEKLYYLKDNRIFPIPKDGQFAKSWDEWIENKLKYQDTIPLTSLSSDIRRLIRHIRQKSYGHFVARSYDDGINTYSATQGVRRGDRRPFLKSTFREMGFLLAETNDGWRKIFKVTSNSFNQINRVHLLKALEGLWSKTESKKVVKLSFFHTHPPRNWRTEELKGLSEGDLAEMLWLQAYLKEKKNLTPEISIYASEISESGDQLYRFSLFTHP